MGAAQPGAAAHSAARVRRLLEEALQLAAGHAVGSRGIEGATDLSGDLVFADDHGLQTAGDGEEVGGDIRPLVNGHGRPQILDRDAASGRKGPDDGFDGRRFVSGGRLVEVEVGLEPIAGGEHHGAGDELLVVDEGTGGGWCADRETLQDVKARVPMVRGETKKHEPNVNRVPLNPSHPSVVGGNTPPVIRAYRGDRPERTPVWFMRQAGRSLPEYRELRVGTDMLETCLTPELASEITLQPVRRHHVDAAIFFSDIVIPVKLSGVDVRIVTGRGPVLENPVRTASEIRDLPPLDPASLDPIRLAVAATVAELGETPLIGFAGAPYTLASYLVEGGPSKEQLRTRALMHSDPESWAAVLGWCAEITGAFLAAQIEAGASAGQLFDSWAGSLSLADYTERVAPHSARALAPARELGVPLVHFGVGTGELLAGRHAVGVDVMGVDWRIPLDEASRRLGGHVPLQGNIDPALLAAPWPVLEAHIREVLHRGLAAPAHVLNLGHGVPPETDPGVLTRIVEFVQHEV